MAQWGVMDIEQLTWLTPPPKGAIMQANQMLHDLNALQDGSITPHGKKMHLLPCHPRIAHMLLMAKEDDNIGLGADISALLEERDPLGKDAGIDINERIEVLRTFRRENRSGGRMERIKKVASSYLRLFDEEEENEPVDPYETGVLLTYAYPERIAHARPGNNAQFQLSNGQIAAAGHKDDLAHEAWLAVANMDARQGLGKIFLASPLNPQDLAPMVKEQEVIKWDTEDGGLSATLDMRIGNIVLKSSPLPDPDPKHLVQAICDAIKKEGEQLLNFDERMMQWQNRILCLRKWRPEGRWPDVSTLTLLQTNSSWLSSYLVDIKKPSQLKKLDLVDILTQQLEYGMQQRLKKLAPSHLTVPSGSIIKVNYRADGLAPVLAVRIQEIFGMNKTPTVNEGRTMILLHLLSPGFKPVQITDDLEHFWKETYFEVRKELKGRYPKHVWPDDPGTEPAIRGVKSRKIK
jgi:ATP-dependent helicase HrpB